MSVLQSGRLFLQEAEPVKDTFIRCGLPTTFVEDLQQAVVRFEQAIAGHSAGRIGATVSDKGITATITQGVQAVRSLDVLVANVLDDDPVAMNSWKRRRHVDMTPKSASVDEPSDNPVPASEHEPLAPRSSEVSAPVTGAADEPLRMASRRLLRLEDAGRGDRLARMPRRMLGHVHEQTEHRRRQRRTADATRLEQTFRGGRPHLGQRPLDDLGDPRRFVFERGDGLARNLFAFERLPLGLRQRLAARIRQQTIHRTAGVPDVKADRGRAARTQPDVCLGNGANQPREILPDLKQRMHDRLHERVIALDHSPQPYLGLFWHRITLPPPAFRASPRLPAQAAECQRPCRRASRGPAC